MPTKLKRLQVLIHPEVFEVIQDLADGTGRTWSGMGADLIHEALEARGLINQQAPKTKHASKVKGLLDEFQQSLDKAGVEGAQGEPLSRLTELLITLQKADSEAPSKPHPKHLDSSPR